MAMRTKLSKSIVADLRRGATEFEMVLKYGAEWVYNRSRYLKLLDQWGV